MDGQAVAVDLRRRHRPARCGRRSPGTPGPGPAHRADHPGPAPAPGGGAAGPPRPLGGGGLRRDAARGRPRWTAGWCRAGRRPAGWSQQRFARRRGNQTDAVVGHAAETAVRVLLPHADAVRRAGHRRGPRAGCRGAGRPRLAALAAATADRTVGRGGADPGRAAGRPRPSCVPSGCTWSSPVTRCGPAGSLGSGDDRAAAQRDRPAAGGRAGRGAHRLPGATRRRSSPRPPDCSRRTASAAPASARSPRPWAPTGRPSTTTWAARKSSSTRW